MSQILLAVHALIAIALVGSILLQRNEGGGLGMGGTGGMAPIRGAANVLTRVTATLAVAFIGMSLLLAIMAANRGAPDSIVDGINLGPTPVLESDASTPEASAPAEPAVPLD